MSSRPDTKTGDSEAQYQPISLAKPPLPLYLRIFGVASLGSVVLLWTLSNFSTQRVSADYPHVFLINILYTCGLQLYFVFLKYKDPIKELRAKYADSHDSSVADSPDDKPIALPQFTTIEHAKISVIFGILYMSSNFAMYYSFSMTPVSIASLMASTSSMWTLLFSRIFGVSSVSLMKLSSVFLTIASVVYFNWYDLVAATKSASAAYSSWGDLMAAVSEKGLQTMMFGNALGVVSAALYGAYSTYLKVICKGDESRVSYSLLFAFTGLYSSIALVPGCMIVHYMGWEQFEWPTLETIGRIALNSAFGTVVANYLWGAAFMFTGPLSVAIGLSFMTPLSLFGDWLQGQVTIHYYHIVATLIMMSGFMLINLADIYKERDIHLF